MEIQIVRFDELSSRFEEPIGSNRWDKPLFTVFPQDETPCKEIADAILLRDTVSPTMANLPVLKLIRCLY